jgi:flagellar motor switch protein FliN/FliY
MMGQEGETELTEALLSGLAEAFNNVLGAWDTAMSEEFGLAVAHSDLKFLEGDILDTLVAEAGLEPAVSAVQSAFSIKIDEVRGGIALMATTECIEKIFVSHPSSKKEAKAPAGPADAGRETALKTTSPVPQPAEKVQVAPAPEVPLARFEELTPHQTTEPPRGVDLILDVPLLVAVELGRKSLSVKDILELVPGSLVELDKLAGEAVDLLVNGKLFARGEVVVIDENFGVRISAIISPKDRIESLR